MRKTVFWIIGMLAVILLVTYSQNIADVLVAMEKGATIPLIVAALFEFGRYAMQASGNVAAFNTVGEQASWRRMFTLILSGTFVNTLAPSGGTVYYALVVDDASSRGIPVGKSTSASVMMQAFLLSGFIVLMLIGFTIMQVAGKLTPVFFICGMVIALIAAFFGGVLFICRKSPDVLRSLLASIETLVARFAVRFTRSHRAPEPWAGKFIDSMALATDAIAHNKQNAWASFGFMVLANGCEMLCFITCGFAFGVTQVNALIGAYVITNIFTIFSPSPNGVGFAEATASLVLASFGTDVATSTAVALTFRGFVFWIPFLIGALLLRKTGFFSKKDETEEEKARQDANLATLFVFVFAFANIAFTVMPGLPQNFSIFTQWLSIGNVFSSMSVVIISVMLLLMARGLSKRSRTTWAFTMFLLIYLAIAQVVGAQSVYVAVAVLVLIVWLFFKRNSFDKLLVHENVRSIVTAVLYAAIITFAYGTCGFYFLAEQFSFPFKHTWLDAVISTGQTLVPFISDPIALTGQAGWFVASVRIVAVVSLLWASLAILFPLLRKFRYEGKIDNSTGVWKTVQTMENGLMYETGQEDEDISQVYVDMAHWASEHGIREWVALDESEPERLSEVDMLMRDVLLGAGERREQEMEGQHTSDQPPSPSPMPPRVMQVPRVEQPGNGGKQDSGKPLLGHGGNDPGRSQDPAMDGKDRTAVMALASILPEVFSPAGDDKDTGSDVDKTAPLPSVEADGHEDKE